VSPNSTTAETMMFRAKGTTSMHICSKQWFWRHRKLMSC